ncbi:hypothetical protein [Amycolatopsis australiensis]|uniref:Uncharacterized protein n=1 Tax=Amycolatopsis australiensis TaxID=546364 RepID=A0A1K1T6L0_9PSEU|nr:hypothetical protein [Amycolatopsis australiensis]SFW91669.1 hypothetical protein SAMN04489730_8084 [Amycolatopsis australiensis]
MTANDKPDDPDAELARSRQHIKEAKEAAAEADLADPAEGDADQALATDPPYHHGEQGTTPSGT